MRRGRVLIFTLCLMLLFSSVALAQEVQSKDFSDVNGHWAEGEIAAWTGQGIIGGYPDGTFQPNRQITRAEFTKILNSALGYQEQAAINFSDVKKGDWFYGEIAQAVKAGYIKGYADGTVKPNDPISRQEAAVIISRIMWLKGNAAQTQGFTDGSRIPSWSKGAVGAVAGAAYMGGYPDKSFQPVKPISRAEALVTLNRVVGTRYHEAGSFGPGSGKQTIEGNVTVCAKDIKLQNLVIKGGLLITAGVGDGDVTIQDTVIEGTTVINGGGENSVIFINTTGKDVVVYKADGKIRIVTQGDSGFGQVVMNSGGNLSEEDLTGAGFETVSTVCPGETVSLNGNFESVSLEANVSLKVADNTTISSLEVKEEAKGASVDINGQASVGTLVLNGAADVTGTGTIKTAEVNVSGSTIAQTPGTVVVAPGTSVKVDGKEISKDAESTPPSGGGSSTSQITVSSIDATFNNKADLPCSSEPFSFDLTDSTAYPDNTLFKGVKITGNYVEGATLVITKLYIANQNWISDPMEVDPQGGIVTTKDLLGALDGGEPGVNLGTLREFREMKLEGYLKKSGCTNSKNLTVTLKFSTGSDPYDLTGVKNEWLDFSKSGTTIIGTIKSGKADTVLSEVEVVDFIWQGSVSTDNGATFHEGKELIKGKIAELAGPDKEWGTVILDDLAGKTIKYRTTGSSIVYTLSIIK